MLQTIHVVIIVSVAVAYTEWNWTA